MPHIVSCPWEKSDRLLGVVLAWRDKRPFLWLALPTAASLPLLLFIVESRVLSTFMALWIGFAGYALAKLEGWRRWSALGLLALLLLPLALRQAGLWLAPHAPAGATVVDRKPQVAYYAGLPLRWPHYGEDLIALEQGLLPLAPVVLVVDNKNFRESRPACVAMPPVRF